MKRASLVLFLTGCVSSVEQIDLPGSQLRFEMVHVEGLGRTPSFWVGAKEVTWAEFDRFAEWNPNDGITRPSIAKSYLQLSGLPPEFTQPELPVTNLRWHAAVAYCEWLSKKTGAVYRLPTEREWALACGTPPADAAWTIESSGNRTHVGGGKARHASGAYDLLGNVWEYALESNHPPDFDPVLLGGSWTSGAELRRTVPWEWEDADPNRPRSTWWFRDGHSQGFRVVRVGEPEGQTEREEAAAKIEIKVYEGGEQTIRRGNHRQDFVRVVGRIRNVGKRSLDEVILKVYPLDSRGKPHVEDRELPQGPRATFNLAFPVLASSVHPGPQRVPFPPGDSRDFSADLPPSYDFDFDPLRFGASVLSIRFTP